MLILGIESSCDETAASKVSGLVKSKKKPNKSSDDLNTDEKA